MNFHRIDLSDLSFQTFKFGRITELNLADFYSGGGSGQLPAAELSAGSRSSVCLLQPWRLCAGRVAASARNSTITLTLRGDHNSNPVCQVNCFANLVAPFNSLVHDPNVPYNQVIQTNLHQALSDTTAVIWQPRIGFAWTPLKGKNKDNLVLRGGFGIFGDVFPGQVAGAMATNTPVRNSFLINNGQGHSRRHQ